ncbi:MAG: hypothetical protein WCK84_07725 [Bacteroidota bacterium]
MKTICRILQIAVITLLLSVSSGCKTYMHFKYGLTQPKEETPEKVVSFLEKHNFPSENQYMFSDSSSYYQTIRNPMFSKHLLSHMIFDRKGAMLQRDTMQCQWSGYDKIKSLSPDSSYEKCSELHLDPILRHIKQFGKTSARNNLINDPDFTVIVTWAKFLGTYNYRLFKLSDAIKLNTKARIRIIWLNIDMQESWKLTPEQKMAIK